MIFKRRNYATFDGSGGDRGGGGWCATPAGRRHASRSWRRSRRGSPGRFGTPTAGRQTRWWLRPCSPRTRRDRFRAWTMRSGRPFPRAMPSFKASSTTKRASFLQAEMAKTDGICAGAFLNAANGEKVAFTDKTGSYIHKGSAKFDVPFTSGKTWQGKPELDERARSMRSRFRFPSSPRGSRSGHWWSRSTEQDWKARQEVNR